MADIFEEVEEGLRQDRLTELWKKYGVFAYLAGALIIGGVALNEYLQYSRAETIETNATKLETALIELEARNYEAALPGLVELIELDAPISSVASHYLAGLRLEGNGDGVAATDALLDSVGEVTAPTEKLALIKAAYLKADDAPRAELETLLAPLLEDDSAFGVLAQELIAAKALQEGDVEFARRQFNFLRLSPNIPPGVERRAQQALATMPPVELDPVDETAPQPETEEEAGSDPASETDAVPVSDEETDQ